MKQETIKRRDTNWSSDCGHSRIELHLGHNGFSGGQPDQDLAANARKFAKRINGNDSA
jgi:hypothetical protein